MIPVALLTYLQPLQSYFALPGVSEVCINRPGELWAEQYGHFIQYRVPELSLNYLWQLARLVAEYNHRDISPEMPILSAILPNGARVQFVVEPACEKDSFVCSIRQVSVEEMLLDHYFSGNQTRAIIQSQPKQQSSIAISELLAFYQAKDYAAFLKQAVLERKNIIISGGTSTGKTTFLNSLLQHVPRKERIITIETDREVRSHHPNSIHLLAAEEGRGVANITMLDLLKASLRLRPDRILVSELRAQEAFTYLRAINSGHPGSITTLHADSPEGCFDQLAFMVIQGGSRLSRKELLTYAKSIVDIVVQIKRNQKGERFVSEIYFNEAINN